MGLHEVIYVYSYGCIYVMLLVRYFGGLLVMGSVVSLTLLLGANIFNLAGTEHPATSTKCHQASGLYVWGLWAPFVFQH